MVELADAGALGFDTERLSRIAPFLAEAYVDNGRLPNAQLLIARAVQRAATALSVHRATRVEAGRGVAAPSGSFAVGACVVKGYERQRPVGLLDARSTCCVTRAVRIHLGHALRRRCRGRGGRAGGPA